MKKLSFVLSFVLMLIFLVPFSSYAAENGGYIVISDKDDSRLAAAADTLAGYLSKITDKDFPVSSYGKGIKFTVSYDSEIPDNGYVIETKENEVLITGNGTITITDGQ